jgi:uncharacterized protein YndB with AHSA1/START domain
MTYERLGTITACYTMTFHRRSKHSAARLWAAITRAEEVSAWMAYPAKVDLRVGGQWFVDFTSTHQDTLPGVIVRVEPEHILTYVWGWSVLEWQLREAETGCEYTFIHNGLADRGEDEEGLAAGWHSFLDQLARHLDGPVLEANEERERWALLKPLYRERLNSALPGRAGHGVTPLIR